MSDVSWQPPTVRPRPLSALPFPRLARAQLTYSFSPLQPPKRSRRRTSTSVSAPAFGDQTVALADDDDSHEADSFDNHFSGVADSIASSSDSEDRASASSSDEEGQDREGEEEQPDEAEEEAADSADARLDKLEQEHQALLQSHRELLAKHEVVCAQYGVLRDALANEAASASERIADLVRLLNQL